MHEIPPRLTLPQKPSPQPQDTTEVALPLYIDRILAAAPVTEIPAISRSARALLVVSLASVAVVTATSIATLWWLPVAVPGIYRLVVSVVVLLIGCMIASVMLWQQYRQRLAVVPGSLITRRVPAMERIDDLEHKVSQDTTGFLKAVRVHE